MQRGGFTANVVTSLINTRIDQNPGRPGQPLVSLVGNRCRQVPHYRLRGSLAWAENRWGAMVGLHLTGEQFEDDLNFVRWPPAAASMRRSTGIFPIS